MVFISFCNPCIVFLSRDVDEEGDQKCALALLVTLFKKDKSSDPLCHIYEQNQVTVMTFMHYWRYNVFMFKTDW